MKQAELQDRILLYCYVASILSNAMKTTLDLPETLLRRAKRKALESNTTLKALVISGLKRELHTPNAVDADPIEQLKAADPSIWRGIKADHYVRRLRKGWK